MCMREVHHMYWRIPFLHQMTAEIRVLSRWEEHLLQDWMKTCSGGNCNNETLIPCSSVCKHWHCLMSEMKTNAPPQILIYRTMGKHCYIPYFYRQVSESTWIGLVSYQYCYTFIALNCLWMLVFFILGKIGAVPFLTSNMILYSHFSFLYWSIVR